MPVTIEEYEKLLPHANVDHGGVKMRFFTPSTMALLRVQTIYEKEPWTLEWIAGFEEDDVFLDCGANVGMYSIWAAATRRAHVYAFEPESQNYAILNRNIRLNGVGDRVTAYCAGLSDRSGLSTLHMTELDPGGSCSAMGEPLDYKQEPMKVAYRQGCVSATLDELVSAGAIPAPDHIKIDVDGIEPKVIAGARNTLADPTVKSLLIETNQNLEGHMAMVRELGGMGFRHDPAQVARAERREGAFTGVAEYIFHRVT